jgi:alpha-galactosidase
MTRRELLQLAAGASAIALGGRSSAQANLSLDSLVKAPARALLAGGHASPAVSVGRTWHDGICEISIANRGADPVALDSVVVFDLTHRLPAGTPVYGEGFQMLSQNGGTLGAVSNLGNYTDAAHYKLAEPAGGRRVYNLLTLQTPGLHHLLAFSSCRRFSGSFEILPGVLRAVLDLEGLALAPGEEWILEEFVYRSGADRHALFEALAARLSANHRPLAFPAPPSGWCSWYCFGPKVTAEQVLDNLTTIARDIPGLRYIQIDDGYQPAMGDWLETGAAFGGAVQSVLRQIRARGFEPAIWVAPFIAEAGSTLFNEHPDWFVQDPEGQPLRADRVTFGGWRRGPWYALDGTHPAAQAHLERVFRVMRDEWGCTYFKLDANFWGAMHGGRFHDPRATRVDAYRRGMAAVLRGTGDAFVLGCNHPLWPSIGVIHGSRSSHDIRRDWKRFIDTARQNLSRNWQNGRLWWNDPDAIVLTGNLSEDEFRFHASAVFASGGLILSGDDLTTIAPARLAMLRKLQPPTGRAARFDDESLRVGTVDLGPRQAICLFNWSDAPQPTTFALNEPRRARDFWTEADLGRLAAGRHTVTVPARSARILMCAA